MKKSTFSQIVVILLPIFVVATGFNKSVYAQNRRTTQKTTVSATPTATPTVTTSTGNSEVDATLGDYRKASQEKRLAAAKKVGDKMIDVRLKDLNKVKTRINNSQCLSDADKTAMATDVDGTITGLTAHKTKVDAATTLEELKPLIQQIRLNFRVYLVVIPKEHGLVGVCRSEKAVSRLDDLTLKIQAKLNQLKNAGQDATAAQAKLDQVKAKLDEATKQNSLAREKFSAMKVANGDETNKQLKSAGQTALKAAHQALQDAKKLLAELKTDLKNFRKAASPTPTSTP